VTTAPALVTSQYLLETNMLLALVKGADDVARRVRQLDLAGLTVWARWKPNCGLVMLAGKEWHPREAGIPKRSQFARNRTQIWPANCSRSFKGGEGLAPIEP
jgi:hypothetical protein